MQALLWGPIYLLSAILVSMIAIWRGVTASPSELLPIPITILLLVGWLLFSGWFTGRDFYTEHERRMGLSNRGLLLFGPGLALSALLVPVLIYVLVLIVVS